jgi:predicted ArsR family transcriptional regulator
VILRDKLLAHLKTRKTPMTAEMIAKRFGCVHDTALKAMNKLIKEGVVEQVHVAVNNRYVKGIL